jgi:hypothetical protein
MIAYSCGPFWRHYVVPALPATIARAQKRTNKPRMFMKTNSRYRMHRAVVALTFRSARRQSKNADLKVGATNCREQSENVYENKGRGQTVTGWRRPRLVGLCDAPEAQACQVVPSVLTCPFGISQTPTRRALRCAGGAGMSGCAVSLDLSIQDIADPRYQGSAPSVDSETVGTKRECL